MSKSFDKMKKDMKNKITLYVKNLSFKMSDEELRKYIIEDCGVDEENVLGATICRDGNKKSKGYGFIDVRWRDDADKEVVLINKKRKYEKPLKNSDFKKFFN